MLVLLYIIILTIFFFFLGRFLKLKFFLGRYTELIFKSPFFRQLPNNIILISWFFFGVCLYVLNTLPFSKFFPLSVIWSISLVVILHITVDLPVTKINIISILLNMFTWGGFCSAIVNYKYILAHPFFLDDLRTFSIYRYSLMFFLSLMLLILVFVYLTLKFIKVLSLKIPEMPWYLDLSKIENAAIFAVLSNFDKFELFSWKFVQSLYDKKKLRKILIFHFVFFQGVSLSYLVFFYNFVFFHGDFRYIFLLFPLTLLKYILRLWESYLKNRFDSYCLEIRALLQVEVKGGTIISSFPLGRDYLSGPLDLIFELTPKAISDGYTEKMDSVMAINVLSKDWLNAAQLHARYSHYKQTFSFFSLIRFIFQVFAWGNIFAYFFFFAVPIGMNFFSFFKRAGNLLSSTLAPRIPPMNSSSVSHPLDIFTHKSSYATEAFKVKPEHYSKVEKATAGDYKAGHPILSDTDKQREGKMPFIGQPTHGNGTPENPSEPLHSSKDFQGSNPRGQRIIYPRDGEIFLETEWLGSPIPGSKEYMADTEVKTNMNKYKSKTKSDDKPQND